MQKILMLTAALVLPVLLVGCHSHKYTKQVENIHHFQDDTWGYQDNSGIWYWYYFNTVNSTNISAPSPYMGSTYRSGGYWIPSNTSSSSATITKPPPTPEQVNNAKVEEEELEVSEEGQPPENAVEAVQAATEATETDSGEAGAGDTSGASSAPSSSPEPEASPDSGSSPSDSGGGPDGGASGGGDGSE